MKGGITSGVVYPGAILALARRYRFKCIGGASAGAIAAAVVAAAEYARQRARPDRAGEPFREVASLPKTLASSPGGTPFMLHLFAPDPPTKPLFDAGIAFLRWGRIRAVAKALRSFWHFPTLALAVALVAVCMTALGDARPQFAVAGVGAAILICIGGLGGDVFRAIRRVGENDFGLCRLGPDVGTQEYPALTGWLHERIQTISGKTSSPLTFADLWGAPESAGEDELNALSRDPQAREIDLQMMTTNLSQGRPMRLPVAVQKHCDRLEDGGGLLFDPEELRRFFPEDVMRHLVEHGRTPSERTAAHLEREAPGRTFHHFPIGAQLPVVVATRMSLSFPVLIAALPLWQLDFHASGARPPLRRVVFSDGGITSNFPVHFFDSPLPRRPTFALNLIGFDTGEEPDPELPERAVQPPAGATQAREPIGEINDLFGFFTAIKDAMQNWRDNAQGRLPGYRDRTAHIKLARGEGGLNLAMKDDKITELNERGAQAGAVLVRLFAGEEGSAPGASAWWNDSRFARFRITMSLIERYLDGFQRGYCAEPDAVTTPYEERVVAGTYVGHYAFNSQTRRAAAVETAEAYVDLADRDDDPRRSLDDPDVPRPRSTLRGVPPT